ncbi:hypothetical protein MASR2M117_01920 [Paludibacter sp.]
MINKYEEIIKAFENKLRKLFSEYQKLQAYNKKLQEELERKNESLIAAHGELLKLRKDNDHLALANQLSGSITDRAEAKKQIDRMVREIDQCLALLDE